MKGNQLTADFQTKGRELQTADQLRKTISELKNVNQELQEAYLDTIYRLALAAEYRDEDIGNHITRMSLYSAMIGEKLGMQVKEVQNIFYVAPMHDVGKIGISDNILMKPGKLTEEEFETIKTHTTIGAKILANSKSEILNIAEEVALFHHEKWNGRGYPEGLSGTKIPLLGRIIGLADAFDALTSRRPYKDPYPIDMAVDIINKERGEHFDPDVVDVFMENIDEILKIKKEVDYAEGVSLSDFAWSERDRESS